MPGHLPTVLSGALRSTARRTLARVPVRARLGWIAVRHRRLLADGGDLAPALHRHRPVVARAWTGPFSTERLARWALEWCADALTAAGVDYFLVNGRNPDEYCVGVRSTDRTRALRALHAAAAGSGLYAAEVSRRPRAYLRPLAARGAPRLLADAEAVRIGAFVSADGTVVAGPEHGCVVEFWRDAERLPDADGALRSWLKTPCTPRVLRGALAAPRRNRVAEIVPEAEQRRARVTVGGREHPTFEPFARPLPDECRFPVDAVYTWVDGHDPDWRAQRDAHLAAAAPLHPSAACPERFESRDELRYALRSLEMYAGFVRNVYIVTDGQTPDWLDTSGGRVHVVDHRDIFSDHGGLPVFNSHAIETRLHHIPGLSEHYLYINDDVFFGRACGADAFFHPNGLAKVFPSPHRFGLGPAAEDEAPVDTAAKNNRDLIAAAFDRYPVYKFKHTPIPQRRSVMYELEERFPDRFRATAGSRFRHAGDISAASSLHHTYALLTGRAVVGEISYAYLDVADPVAFTARARHYLAERGLDAFCVNDTGPLDSAEAARRADARVRRFLDQAFPFPSRTEHGSAQEGEPSVPAARAPHAADRTLPAARSGAAQR